jgi:hypothetical protein
VSDGNGALSIHDHLDKADSTAVRPVQQAHHWILAEHLSARDASPRAA